MGAVVLLTSAPVKTLRVLLLVLLAVMLPVRGVMAATLMCPQHAGADSSAHAMPMGGDGEHVDAAGVAHGDDGALQDAHHHDGESGSDTCNLCSACCSVPPVPSAALAMLPPLEGPAATFPSFAAPALAFQSEGPERPPRSI